jgi:hypothetical protein
MSVSKDITVEVSTASRKRRPVWPLNILSALLMPFGLSLSSPDPLSQTLSALSITLALGCAYFSVRIRFNVLGLLLLLAAAYCQTFYLIALLKNA